MFNQFVLSQSDEEVLRSPTPQRTGTPGRPLNGVFGSSAAAHRTSLFTPDGAQRQPQRKRLFSTITDLDEDISDDTPVVINTAAPLVFTQNESQYCDEQQNGKHFRADTTATAYSLLAADGSQRQEQPHAEEQLSRQQQFNDSTDSTISATQWEDAFLDGLS